MKRVLLVGLKPETIAVSDAALPPGMGAAESQAGIERALQQMGERGWRAEACLVTPDVFAGAELARRLGARNYDVVVVGAGIRLPPESLSLLEVVINAVHKAAPNTSIAFNTHPEDTGEAAARWV